MSLDFSSFPVPKDRTPQDWVDFYVQLEAEAAIGTTVKFGEMTWEMDSLDSIRKARLGWERRVVDKSRSGRTSVGGNRFTTPDFS